MEENKKVYSCPNLLFIAWLEELKKTAKRNHDKAFFTYKRALAALKKFPMPLNSGKECLMLDGFGQKTCELIDKKLHELSKNQGLSVRKALKKANKELLQGRNNSDIIYSKGSGGYSIICGLNDLEETLHSESGNLKKEIIQMSVKYFKTSSNSDLSVILWKCIPKLLNYNLISKDGLRYRLTTTGKDLYTQWTLGKKLKKCISNHESLNNDSDIEKRRSSGSDTKENNYQIQVTDKKINSVNFSDQDKESDSQLSVGQTNVEKESKRLRFYYCKFLESFKMDLVNHKSEAATKIIHDQTYFRIKAKYDDLIAFNIDFELDLSNLDSTDGDIFAFILDKQAPVKCSYVKEINEKPQLLQGKPVINVDKKNSKRSNEIEKKISKKSKGVLNEIQTEPLLNNCTQITEKRICQLNEFSTDLEEILRQKPTTKFNNNNKLEDESEIAYLMPPNSFEIILIVDNRENFGAGKLKQHLCPDLIKKGVKLETRPIPIGDFVWIARDENGREAVLDLIIERKRYDDLAKSVQDSRFKDQKLRMKRSGISQIIYLLEKCKGMNNLSMTVEALHQTLINSQINYQSDIKISENEADTISYIHLLTVKVIETFSKKSLTVYKDSIPRRPTSRMNPFNSPAIDYLSFKEAGKKTKPIKISEMFAKHLTCINGITAEKAKAIVDKYHVPRILIETYEQISVNKNKQLLLSGLKLASGRSIGTADSKKVYACYSRI